MTTKATETKKSKKDVGGSTADKIREATAADAGNSQPKSSALATTGGALAGAEAIPDYIKSGKGRGLENVEQADLLLPRLKVLQDLSPEVKNKDLDPEGKPFTAGTIINSLTKAVYGTSVEIVPVAARKSRMRWAPRHEGKKILCSSDDSLSARAPNGLTYDGKPTANCSECRFKDFDETAKKPEDRKPQCTVYHNFPALLAHSGQPIAASFARGSLNVGKQIVTLAKYAGAGLDLFAKKYRLVLFSDKRPLGEFWNFKVEPAGFPEPPLYKAAESFFESVKTKRVDIDAETEDEAEPTVPAGDEKEI